MKNLKLILLIAVLTVSCEYTGVMEEAAKEEVFDLSLIPGSFTGKSKECMHYTDFREDSSDYNYSIGGGYMCRNINADTSWLNETTYLLSEGEYSSSISSLGDNRYLMKFNHGDTSLPAEMVVEVNDFYANYNHFAYFSIVETESHEGYQTTSPGPVGMPNEHTGSHFKYSCNSKGLCNVYYIFKVRSNTDAAKVWTFTGHKFAYEN